MATSLTNQVNNQSIIPSTDVIQLTLNQKMTTALVVETSVTQSSLSSSQPPSPPLSLIIIIIIIIIPATTLFHFNNSNALKVIFIPLWSNNLDCKTVLILAYSSTREQSNERSGTRLKTESETGDRHVVFLPPHTRKTLTPRVTDFFTDFEKKTTVLQPNNNLIL